MKGGPLASMPSGNFNANAAWLTAAVMAFNLSRAVGTLAGGQFARATTATIRSKIINVAARIASSARRIRLHLPTKWLWETQWTKLFNTIYPPPKMA